MKTFKKIISIICLSILVAGSVFAGSISSNNFANAEESQPQITQLEKTFSMKDDVSGMDVELTYSTILLTEGDIDIVMSAEHDEEKLETFQKYVKKSIDSASVGEVFYVTMTPSDPTNNKLVNGTMKFKIKLPKFYKNKELAIIPFQDYRTAQRVKSAEMDDEGYITFYGNTTAYAYAIVYNGIYKHIILIAIIMVVVLTICILVKIYCLRKDNPEYKEKKKQKAIQEKKEQHKQNRRLAQELKREKEKLTKKNHDSV